MNTAFIYCDECKQLIEVPIVVAADQLNLEKPAYICADCVFKDDLEE